MSLIAHYLLNDNAANTTVADASGNGYNATAPANTSTLHVAGKVGSGALALGTGCIQRAHTAAIAITGDLTLAFWFKNVAGNESQIGNWNYGGAAYEAWEVIIGYDFFSSAVSPGRLALRHGDGTAFAVWQAAGQPLNDTNWRHVCIKRTSPNQIQNVTFYVDGSLVSGSLATGTATRTAVDDASSYLYINRGAPVANVAYDDFRIYNEAIAAETLTRIYNGGAGQEANWPPYLYHRRPTLIGV
jgi:hypothetical protein